MKMEERREINNAPHSYCRLMQQNIDSGVNLIRHYVKLKKTRYPLTLMPLL